MYSERPVSFQKRKWTTRVSCEVDTANIDSRTTVAGLCVCFVDFYKDIMETVDEQIDKQTQVLIGKTG